MTKTVFNFRFFCFFKVKLRKLPKGIRFVRSKTDGFSTGAENEAFELEKLNKNKGCLLFILFNEINESV